MHVSHFILEFANSYFGLTFTSKNIWLEKTAKN